jgi:transposase-like protein
MSRHRSHTMHSTTNMTTRRAPEWCVTRRFLSVLLLLSLACAMQAYTSPSHTLKGGTPYQSATVSHRHSLPSASLSRKTVTLQATTKGKGGRKKKATTPAESSATTSEDSESDSTVTTATTENASSNSTSTTSSKKKENFVDDTKNEGTTTAITTTSNSNSYMTIPIDWEALEDRVVASAQAELDMKRLSQALEARNVPTNDLWTPTDTPVLPSPWKIAVAAASVSSITTLLAFQNVYLSGIVLLVVFIAASRDPLEETSDDVTGALARTVGRVTIDSLEASQPKIRALARAVITGEEEIVALKQQMQQLQRENQELALWKERRIKIDAIANKHKIDELKLELKENNLPVKGKTKADMLMQLVENDILKLD